jgi:uncharacterized integral membrane protein
MDTPISPIYQGQFGEFTITDDDRQDVIWYRAGLAIAGGSWAIGVAVLFLAHDHPQFLLVLTPLFFLFSAGLGLSLWKIHIYLAVLHHLLQLFWLIGTIVALIFTLYSPAPLSLFIYSHPASIFGIGFIFAALTGIFFKEAFCFNRLETKFLTVLVPLLLLGHLCSFLPLSIEKILLVLWAGLFLVFVYRKIVQPIPPDIGDKSVFTYLQQQKSVTTAV